MSLQIPAGLHPNLAWGPCHVLIVDDDPESLAEYVELTKGLGYSCQSTDRAAVALQMISTDPRIGIIVADVQMPDMDGLTLLDEMSSRFMATRPLVALILTGQISLQTAVQAMRSNATDFLTKPVSFEDLSAALRRASVRWTQLVGRSKVEALTQLAGAQSIAFDATEASGEVHTPGQIELQSFVRSIVKSRQNRAQFLNSSLFSDPAWDILLDLTSAALEGKPAPASSVSAASQSPLSTALRYIRQLIDAGLIRSWRDPGDKRRTLLELEPETFQAMKDYLISVHRQHQPTSRSILQKP